MNHGGRRKGAGRPKGSNAYGESTKPLRIPTSRLTEITALLQHNHPVYNRPLYASHVQAGFPSPADDYIEMHLDLNLHLIKHPSATFFVMASGDSMTGAGIQSGDMLIVDKSLNPTDGAIVIAALNGELTVKRLSRKNGQVQLHPENKNYPIINITAEEELLIWGVVTYVIHQAS